MTDDDIADAVGTGLKKGARVARKASKGVLKAAAKTATPRRASKWSKYIKNPRNQIKFKSGVKKGLLNMKAMGREYRRKNR
jgi:hypothetical protein